jgi:hypothetical protein
MMLTILAKKTRPYPDSFVSRHPSVNKRILVVAAMVTAVIGVGASAIQASTIVTAEETASGTAVTLDQNPVVSAVLSTPTTTNGVATTRYIFLVDDGTGSMDVFGPTASGGALVNGYVPAAGDNLTISGPNSPFNGIPEMGTPTAITKNSSGNATPAPLAESITDVSGYTTQPAAGATWPSFAGHLITISGVTISSATTGNYGTTNVSVTLTDSASHTLVGFYNPTTYALANQNLFGTPIASGPVNVTGLLQLFSGAPELLLMSVTPTPEPASLSMIGLLGGAMLIRRRK